MLPYWLLFLFPAFAALQARPTRRFQPDGAPRVSISGSWVLVFAILATVIGFRYEVGGDWGNYLRYLVRAESLSFSSLTTLSDPSYWALNILSLKLGWGIAGVNFMGGLLFSAGLVIFCRSLPRPWLALACAVPYLIIVVSMGYTRQGLALSLVMIGIVALVQGRFKTFVIFILIAATFHKSAVLLLPIAGLSIATSRYVTIPLVVVATALGYVTLLQDSVETLVHNYQDEQMRSAGALLRLTMNAVPATLFLLLSKKMGMSFQEARLWKLFSLLSVGMFFAFFPTNLSTALDRLALYIIPLQLVVFSHLPDAIGKPGRRNQIIVFGILVYYAIVMFVWLNYAVNSHRWLPYQMDFGL